MQQAAVQSDGCISPQLCAGPHQVGNFTGRIGCQFVLGCEAEGWAAAAAMLLFSRQLPHQQLLV